MFEPELVKEIAKIAAENELEPEALMAIVQVESAGRLGARVGGRTEPLIRFEGHYFYRLLSNSKRNLAVVKGLAHARAGKVKNPVSQTARWKMLGRAKVIDRAAALASCSWGCGQVMGAHWRWLGYGSIDALVMEARDGAAGQIRLMVRYIMKANLSQKLQEHDWAGFARAYNGPAYRKHRYDAKMRNAYHRFRLLPGNPDVDEHLNKRNQLQILKFGSHGSSVVQLQEDLSGLGFPLSIDGDFGPATERSLKAFQREYGLLVDGIFGPKSLEMLSRHIPRRA